MKTISLDDVKKMAGLSALTLSDVQVVAMQTDLSHILEYVEQMQTVNTDSVEPTYQVHGLDTITRPDSVIDYNVSQNALLLNAPKQSHCTVVVPRVLE